MYLHMKSARMVPGTEYMQLSAQPLSKHQLYKKRKRKKGKKGKKRIKKTGKIQSSKRLSIA